MRLYLVQHGHALAKEVDPDRPLSDAGRGDVERLAAFLARSGLRVETVVHSGKTRARQTAEILAAAVCEASPESRADLGPNDPVGPVAEAAETWTADAMLVGHLPFMARLASHLVGAREDRGAVAFQPGGVACLERAGDGTWAIAWMLRPELLAAGGA
ncbi:MAG: phosphohistidine phosphatase SixA [Deltaproteobacteria bacterium]|nr:MAG: phosphohistidine phosphatase SixA [Deltaproteobacteria bacterium]